MAKKQTGAKEKKVQAVESKRLDGYWWNMSYAPKIEEGYHWLQVLPIAVWTAVVIMIVRMASYERNMTQFYWSSGGDELADFFSYYKMIAILIITALVILMVLFRFVTQSFSIKKSSLYIPMIVYAAFVLISYAASEYKDFSLIGYVDRFEGTLVLLAYMFMLFYTINTVSTEKHVKFIVYLTGITSAMLGLLGLSQGLDRDFFRTALGQKLISPNSMLESGYTIDEMIDQAAANGREFFEFTFQNRQIYQTVYNINYVSFYLTLLIPLFGLIFIHLFNKGKDEKPWKTVLFGLLFALLIYNLIGSASSGGFFGMAIVVLLALILLNKKIINWWKPVAILLVITAIVGGITFDRWLPEISNAVAGLNANHVTSDENVESALTGHLDYIDTVDYEIRVSIDGRELAVSVNPETISMSVKDTEGNAVGMQMIDETTRACIINDDAFTNVTLQPALDSEKNVYLIMHTNNPHEQDWVFAVTSSGIYYRNGIGKLVDLDVVPWIGFENNLSFGSGRGYIWSRSLPMMKDTMLVGYGADTYCLYYPHIDYVGKYNCPNYSTKIDIIVDKPHNMYMAMWIGTGMFSFLAFAAIVMLYFIQSVKTYWRRKPETFLEFVGIGIFLGVIGFAATGLVDDSTVSVMPMFYGLLGTGVAVNMMLLDGKSPYKGK